MIKEYRKHPSIFLYLDDKKIVTFYSNGDARNEGAAQLESQYNSQVAMLHWNNKTIPVMGKQEIENHGDEQTYIYKFKTISEKLYKSLNKSVSLLRTDIM